MEPPSELQHTASKPPFKLAFPSAYAHFVNRFNCCRMQTAFELPFNNPLITNISATDNL